MSNRVSLRIDSSVLQRLLKRNVLMVNEFTCDDCQSKQQVLKIFGELTADQIRNNQPA